MVGGSGDAVKAYKAVVRQVDVGLGLSCVAPYYLKRWSHKSLPSITLLANSDGIPNIHGAAGNYRCQHATSPIQLVLEPRTYLVHT